MRAALADLDQGEFTEGHELDRKTMKQVPKAMIGHRLLNAQIAQLPSFGCQMLTLAGCRRRLAGAAALRRQGGHYHDKENRASPLVRRKRFCGPCD
jgi:hypothetical protein